MGIKDYLLGRKLVLTSSLDPAEVQDRINRQAHSSFAIFSFGTAGWARFGRFRLRQRTSLIDYNAKPMLVGRLSGFPGGTRLRANFGATLWMKAFFAYWYVFLAFFTAILVATGGFKDGDEVAKYLTFLIIPLFAALPIGMHHLFNGNAEHDLEEMLKFLDDAVGARIEPDAYDLGR